jgi:hypothetical protein
MTTFFAQMFNTQQELFPALETELSEELSENYRLLIQTVEAIRPGRFVEPLEWLGRGRPKSWRLAIFVSFVAKAAFNLPTTRALLDRLAHDVTLRRLCGWEKAAEVPDESTFSRAFAEFARARLPEAVHEALVRASVGPKLAGHVSRDSTAIIGREAPVVKAKPPVSTAPRRKRGRPRKDEPPRPAKPVAVVEQQLHRSLEENLALLPQACDIGGKKNSKGHTQFWIGYKFHLDVIDGDIPVASVLTGASVHDSQVAIPLAQMSAARVVNLYDLMDAAYDVPAIRQFSEGLGHVPIIAPNARRRDKGTIVPLSPAQAARFKERTSAERVNSDLKDNHGGNFVRVRGTAKVAAHLMFGLIVVTVKGLRRLLR